MEAPILRKIIELWLSPDADEPEVRELEHEKQTIKQYICAPKWNAMTQLALISRIQPQLLVMLDPSQFADSLILATLKSASTGTTRVHLSNLLATLLGTNRQSTPDEFALRLQLKQTILRAAVHLMHENLQSALQVKSGLLILLALTAACNVFECNRVLVSTMFFKHSTEFLLKETSYLSDLSEIFSKQLFADDSEVFCLCVLSAYQTCEYLKRRRVYG